MTCRWCGKSFEDHLVSRPSGAPQPRMPCLGLRDGYLARAEALPIVVNEDVGALTREVRRLQEYEQRAFAQEAQLSKAAAELAAQAAEHRAAMHAMSVNEGKLHARIAQLETEVRQLRNIAAINDEALRKRE